MKIVTVIALMSLCGCKGSLDDGNADMSTNGATNAMPNNDNATPNSSPNATPNNGPNNVASDMGSDPGDLPIGMDVTEPPFDAGPCDGAAFGSSAFSLNPIAGSGAQDLHAAATSGGGAIVGWRASDGIHVAHVDGTGAIVSDTTVTGDELYGLAAHDGGRAAMVTRGSDILALVILDGAGAVISDQTIIGDVPHDVTENEWFGTGIRAGTMTWTGTQWATYFTVQRLWNDGIAHYGDQLRLYEADGSSNSMVWDWGCSHSMEVAISHNGDRLGPVCSSDCFPSKGVHFNHRGGQLWPDENGSNCSGGYATTVGASVPVPGGFWMVFGATDNRQSYDVALAKIDGTTPGSPVWLTEDATDDRDIHATTFEDDLVVAWNAAGTNQFALASGVDGSMLAGPLTVEGAELGSASDFFVYANGDVGWAQPAGGTAGLARLRACR